MNKRLILILVFAIFLAPVLLSILMHSRWWNYQPAQLRNYGQLVQPVQALAPFNATAINGDSIDQASLLDHWTLLAVTPGACAELCRQRIDWLDRLRETQGRHQQRLNVLMLATGPAASANLPGSAALAVLEQFPAGWLAQLPQPAEQGQSTYLIDPLGNIIMVYPPSADPTGVRKDLKRILTWSQADTES